MMNTKQSNTTTRTCTLITSARQAQELSLRDFAEKLHVSHQQVKNYEAGQQPDRERVAEWITSDAPWVHQLGLEIFGAQFGDIIQAVLVPNVQRYTLTAKGEAASE